jgi:hypothetical protein
MSSNFRLWLPEVGGGSGVLAKVIAGRLAQKNSDRLATRSNDR